MSTSHPLVQLARDTIENYVSRGKTIQPPKELTPEMEKQAGTFVSIHKHGMLRGCIGTIEPTQANVAQEVIQNAISAATRDPRFPPIMPEELADLDIKVDVLSEPEPVESMEELDPRRYGVIVVNRTANASGRSRLPAHAGQARSFPSNHSFHQISSPVCSSSKPASSRPVP